MNREATVIGGRYELIRRIGSGGMADVFLGMDTLLRRRVAVKVLNAESAADPVFVERFRREAQAVAQLNQANVVSVYDWGALGGTYFMVMEYVEGETLKERLRRGPLPEAEALDIAAAIALALESAHRRGIIHRDIKPQNVLLSESGEVKVADFGIAYTSELTQLTRTHAVSGTAHYLSPEQAQGKPVDKRADIYSLGIVLYEMLAGREPFGGSTLVEIAMRHVHEAPVPPMQIRPEISPAANAVVLKALAKNPEQRYASAADMRRAIMEAAAGLRAEKHEAADRTAPAPLVPAATVRARPTRQVAAAQSSGRTWLQRGLVAVPLIVLVPVLAALGLGALHGSSGAGNHAGATSTPVRHVAARGGRTPVSPPRRGHAAHPAPAAGVRPTAPPAPTATPVPATPPPPTSVPPTAPPAPTATAVAAGPPARSGPAAEGGPDPRAAVQGFYQAIGDHDFTRAAQYWTPSMLSRYDTQQNINGRFGDTIWIRVENMSVSQDGPNSAIVSVSLLEKKRGGPPAPLNGTWQVVKTPGGWQLNNPTF